MKALIVLIGLMTFGSSSALAGDKCREAAVRAALKKTVQTLSGEQLESAEIRVDDVKSLPHAQVVGAPKPYEITIDTGLAGMTGLGGLIKIKTKSRKGDCTKIARVDILFEAY